MKSLWLTDHDLIRELSRTTEIQALAKGMGVQVGFGVEITVEWLKKEHHLLGYFPDSLWEQSRAAGTMLPDLNTLKVACAKVKSSRETRNKKLVQWLNSVLGGHESGALQGTSSHYFKTPEQANAFVPFDVEAVATFAKNYANLMEPTSLGRPHFSKFLGTRGVNIDLVFGPRSGSGHAVLTATGTVLYDADAKNSDGAWKGGVRLEALMHSATLGRRGIAFKPLPILEAIRLIANAGGRAVVAHPPTLGTTWATKFGPSIKALAAGGLWGIEGFSSEISAENHLLIEDLANENGLAMTGGSDNHGTLKSYAKLGDVHRHGTDLYAALEAWARDGPAQTQRLHDLSDF